MHSVVRALKGILMYKLLAAVLMSFSTFAFAQERVLLSMSDHVSGNDFSSVVATGVKSLVVLGSGEFNYAVEPVVTQDGIEVNFYQVSFKGASAVRAGKEMLASETTLVKSVLSKGGAVEFAGLSVLPSKVDLEDMQIRSKEANQLLK